MKLFVVFAIAAVGAYFFLSHPNTPPPAPPPPANAANADTTPAAHMQNRIDNLSGAAPAEP